MIQSSSAGPSVRPLEDRHFGRRQRLAHGDDQQRSHDRKGRRAQHAAEQCRIFRRLPDGDELFHAGRPSGRPRIAGTVQFTAEDCLYLE